MCVCVRACVCVCMCVCARARARAPAFFRVCLYVFLSVFERERRGGRVAGKEICEREGGRKEGRGKEMEGRREREGERWEDRRVEMGGDDLSLSSPLRPSHL